MNHCKGWVHFQGEVSDLVDVRGATTDGLTVGIGVD